MKDFRNATVPVIYSYIFINIPIPIYSCIYSIYITTDLLMVHFSHRTCPSSALPVIRERFPAAEHPTGAKLSNFLVVIMVDARVRVKILFLQVLSTAAGWVLQLRGFQSCISQNSVVATSWALCAHRISTKKLQ